MNTRKLEYWTSLFDTCPPETPYQLYINEALDAVGEEHGQVLMELSEHTAGFVVDVANTAAFAALDVANVSNDWRDVVESLRSKRPTVTSVAPVKTPAPAPQKQPGYRSKWRKQKMRALVRDNFTCQAQECKCKDLARLTVHHIQPKSEGGTNELSNLVTLCDHHHSLLHSNAAPARQAAYEAMMGGAL